MAKAISVSSCVRTQNGTTLEAIYQMSVDELDNGREFEVASGATDSNIFPADLTTATFLWIVANAAVTIKLNGSATAFTLIANRPLMLPGSWTALTVSNGTGATANLTVLGAGT